MHPDAILSRSIAQKWLVISTDANAPRVERHFELPITVCRMYCKVAACSVGCVFTNPNPWTKPTTSVSSFELEQDEDDDDEDDDDDEEEDEEEEEDEDDEQDESLNFVFSNDFEPSSPSGWELSDNSGPFPNRMW